MTEKEIFESSNIPENWRPFCSIINGVVHTPSLDVQFENSLITHEEYEERKVLENRPIVEPDEVLKSKIEVVTINTLIDMGVI